MKKSFYLLSAGLFLLSTVSIAQTTRAKKITTAPIEVPNRILPQEPLMLQQSNLLRTGNGANQSLTATLMGTAGNAFGTGFASRAQLWYNADLNVLVQTHRVSATSFPTYSSGYYQVDVSYDQGVSFTVNQGPIYTDVTFNGTSGTQAARYPQSAIYNPSGNTDPSLARVTYFGPIVDQAVGAAPPWVGYVYGASNLDGSNANQAYLLQSPGVQDGLIPTDMHIVKNTGDSWVIDAAIDQANANVYLDKIILSHGVWDAGNNRYAYTTVIIPTIGSCLNSAPVDQRVAFDDAGIIGYATVLNHGCPPEVGSIPNNGYGANYGDSTIYFTVYKTTDGGATWNLPYNVYIQDADALLLDTLTLSAGFEFETVVDASSNLHIATCLHPAALGAAGALAIIPQPGLMGFFDIYTIDQGTTWMATLLGKPLTFSNEFGTSTANPVGENNRPNASRSWDGSKIFMSWFDTDTLIYAPIVDHENRNPNMNYRGYDINTNMWSVLLVADSGDADAIQFQGNCSYYVIDNGGGSYTIPTSFSIFGSTDDPTVEMTLAYMNEAVVSSFDQSLPSQQLVALPVSAPAKEFGFSISAAFPNPTSSKASIDLGLTNSSNVVLTLTDITGKIISTTNYGKMNAGLNKLTIDAKNLSAGLYIYTVNANGKSLSGKLSVK